MNIFQKAREVLKNEDHTMVTHYKLDGTVTVECMCGFSTTVSSWEAGEQAKVWHDRVTIAQAIKAQS